MIPARDRVRVRIRVAGLRSAGIFVAAFVLGSLVLSAPVPLLATSDAPAWAILLFAGATVAWLLWVMWLAATRPGWVALEAGTLTAKHAFQPLHRIELANATFTLKPWVGGLRPGGVVGSLSGPAIVIDGKPTLSFACVAPELVQQLALDTVPPLGLGPQFVVPAALFAQILQSVDAQR